MIKGSPLTLRAHARCLPLLGTAATLLILSAPVYAADTPFDLESSSWMSFDRYKDKPHDWLAPDQRNEVQAQPVIASPPVLPANMPKLTEPTRPVVAPVMPGLNKNFDIQVNSTEDNHLLPVIAPDKPNDQPDIAPPDTNWKNAIETAHNAKPQSGGDGDNANSGNFNVRYTALPGWFQTPQKKPAMTPVPAAALPPVKIAQPIVPAPPPTPPSTPAMSPADVAACAALDAYKKRQLQAIESDRQTLTALQGAIAQLGLQKQLDFMPGVNGSLNAQTGQGVMVPVANAQAKN